MRQVASDGWLGQNAPASNAMATGLGHSAPATHLSNSKVGIRKLFRQRSILEVDRSIRDRSAPPDLASSETELFLEADFNAPHLSLRDIFSRREKEKQ